MSDDTKKPIKKLPNNNEDTADATPKKPISYTISMEGTAELLAVIDELVHGKFSKQAIHNVLNKVFSPVFKK